MNSEKEPQINSGSNPWLKEGLFDDVEFRQNETIDFSKTTNKKVRDYLDTIEKYLHTTEQVKDFLKKELSEEPKEYDSPEDFLQANPGYAEKMREMPYAKKDVLNMYTGFEYKYFNILARGPWIYEELGVENEEIKKLFKEEYIPRLTSAIMNAPAPTEDYVTFRGANIDSFMGYGLYKEPTVNNLKNLEGQFYLNESYMSTSLTKEASFVDREFDDSLRSKCTLEIHYHIPAGCHDSAALLNPELSTAVGQQEVVIKDHTLNYIDKVTESESGMPVIDMYMIPLEIWYPEEAKQLANRA